MKVILDKKAHFKTEICNSIGPVKYSLKYVYKGSDKIGFAKVFDRSPNDSRINVVTPAGCMLHYIYK